MNFNEAFGNINEDLDAMARNYGKKKKIYIMMLNVLIKLETKKQ